MPDMSCKPERAAFFGQIRDRTNGKASWNLTTVQARALQTSFSDLSTYIERRLSWGLAICRVKARNWLKLDLQARMPPVEMRAALKNCLEEHEELG